MSHPAGREGAPIRFSETEPADLGLLMGRIGRELQSASELGLLSITVLQKNPGAAEQSWRDYETVRREIALFLARYSVTGLRRGDVVLDPLIAGNTFVILLSPPRGERSFAGTDTAMVRERLQRALRAHCTIHLSNSVAEVFGVYVGSARMLHESEVTCERIIYRCLEESLADAMSQKRAEFSLQAAELKEIVRGRRVRAVFQPLVDLNQRRIFGFEALTRVSERSFDSPERLFRAAQENGLLWHLERVCRQCALESLPPMDHGELLFLNVERESFNDPELLDGAFSKMLSEAGLAPNNIVLEMTEHSTVEDFDVLRSTLCDFRQAGYRLAMDDVGAGYAGLHAIAEIEPDYLKVDMTLVRDLHLRPIKRELIATIRRFTENTGTVLIAEGVERPEELASLTELGVGCAQGYLLSRPGAPPRSPDWDTLLA